jgi:DNA-binding LytR/AlgR family response regulator
VRIVIVEDEYSIARDIEHQCRAILGDRVSSLRILQTMEEAAEHLNSHAIDLLVLDLNLGGKSGYDLLNLAVSGSFHTIIVSAHTDQALRAFEYGVLDFLPKPLDPVRLKSAFDRYFGRSAGGPHAVQYLTARKHSGFSVISVDEVLYFKAANYYSEAVLQSGRSEILDKSLDRLGQILPSRFVRVHRSFIVDSRRIASFTPVVGGTSRVVLKSGEALPLSRRRHKELRRRMGT